MAGSFVRRSGTGAKSFSFVAYRRSRASSRATRRRPRDRNPRRLGGRHEKFNLPGNAFRGASRKPVEPDKLVIEQRIFLSFSGREVALPIARARGAISCPTYKKRRQLLRPPRPINIVYVSTSIGGYRRACEFLVSLRISAPYRRPHPPPNPAVSADTNAARAVLYIRVEHDKISSSPLGRKEESCQPPTFLQTSDHLSKLRRPSSSSLSFARPFHPSCPTSHTRRLLGNTIGSRGLEL